MFKKKTILIALLITGGFLTLFAQQGISLSVTPGLDIPTGGGDRSTGTYTLSGDTKVYSPGGGFSLHGNWGLAAYPLFLSAGVDTSFISTVNDRAMTFVGLTAGGGYSYANYLLNGRAYLGLGGALGTYFTADPVTNLYLKFGASCLFNISNTFSVGPAVEYRYFYNNYNGIFIGLSAKASPVPPVSEDQARYIGIQLAPLYPALYRNYEVYPAGLISFVNGEQEAIENLEIRYYQKDYMDKPVVCGEFSLVEPGKTVSVPVTFPLNEEIIGNGAETNLTGEITIRYRYKGRNKTLKTTKPFTLAESHKIIDDNPRKKVLFVTPDEPSLSDFAQSVTEQLNNVTVTPVDRNFRTAMGLYTALAAEGFDLKLTEEEQTGVDKTFQYPVETLALKKGEEKDIALAYAALLYAAGIKPALLELPGKTMVALALGLPREEAVSILNRDDYIDYAGEIWIPLDLAALDLAGFIDAWMSGAALWQGTKSDDKSIIVVEEAWNQFKPVLHYPYAEEQGMALLKEAQPILEDYEAELTAFVEKSIAREEKILMDKINRTGDTRSKIRLGVLYARYGLLDRAKEQFEPLSYDYAAAAINMGNVFFLEGDYVKAYINYIAATEMDKKNKYALLGKARVARELGEQETAESTYRALSAVDINLAIPFSYLIEGEQAEVDENTRETVFWVEE
ncbi:MAG: hypothetical protein PQJ59_02305 [Spirochaetales bacterium]|nr:hypothetical protein [Spirochaetales bacterium]